MKKIYLATPYTHPDPAVRLKRFEAVCKKAAELMNEGHIVFSPISHGHPIAIAGNLPIDWQYWQNTAKAFIGWADEVCVFVQVGWGTSTGVTAEIAIATKLGIPIVYTGEVKSL